MPQLDLCGATPLTNPPLFLMFVIFSSNVSEQGTADKKPTDVGEKLKILIFLLKVLQLYLQHEQGGQSSRPSLHDVNPRKPFNPLKKTGKKSLIASV